MIARAYFGIDHEILWDIVRNKVPLLVDVIKRIDAESPEQAGGPD